MAFPKFCSAFQSGCTHLACCGHPTRTLVIIITIIIIIIIVNIIMSWVLLLSWFLVVSCISLAWIAWGELVWTFNTFACHILLPPSKCSMSSDFNIIFWDVKIKWLTDSIFLHRQCQHSSTLFRELCKMVDICKISENSKILFYLAKYAIYGHETLGPKSF